MRVVIIDGNSCTILTIKSTTACKNVGKFSLIALFTDSVIFGMASTIACIIAGKLSAIDSTISIIASVSLSTTPPSVNAETIVSIAPGNSFKIESNKSGISSVKLLINSGN